MRTILKITIIGLLGLFLTGCATGSQVQVADSDPVKIFKTNDGYIIFDHKKDIKESKDFKNNLEDIFLSIAKYGNENGYKYFAFNNEDINNLQGNPINTFDNFRKYNLRGNGFGGNGKDGYSFLPTRKYHFEVTFFKEKQVGLFLYNINSIKKELKSGN